ncbi:hypothetical protein B0H14DRAFT_3433028 [Mycena olivaceomarginata]|nr:hypothetical protein B0H14DRAFT_3433028 [Mycena olivaceomarginata]
MLFNKKVDPPGSLFPLGLQVEPKTSNSDKEKNKKVHRKKASVSSSSSSLDPLTASSVDINGTPKHSEDEGSEKSSGMVLVKFRHPLITDIPPQQVPVGNIIITNSVNSAGEVKHEANLTKLIPAAIENHSPMKADRQGRISRPGLTAGTMDIGHVSNYVKGPLPAKLEYD